MAARTAPFDEARRVMRIRCSRCQTPLELGDAALPESLTCPSCNAEFIRSAETIVVESGESEPAATYVPQDQHTGSRPSVGLIGDYEILEEIAHGGMGVIYRARQRGLDRIVALKTIRREFSSDVMTERFGVEAEAAGQLDHPAIVPVYEIGRHDGELFYSMAFVDGQSLRDQLEEGPLQPKAAVRLLQAVAEGLQYAHERGIIHRDLKPHNIMIDRRGQARVADFGLAKRRQDSELTSVGDVMGTPSYMPPEQARGDSHAVDGRADVYSLGATFYHMLTGRPPFQAASAVETIHQVLDQEPLSPRALNSAIPRDIETICLKCLRKDPERRYQTPAELSEDLGRSERGEPITARPVGTTERIWLWCRRNPAVATAAAVACLLTVVGWFSYQRLEGRAAADLLLKAETPEVLAAARRAEDYRFWSEPVLRAVANAPASTAVDQRRQLHARLGLVRYDRAQADALLNQLLELSDEQLEYLAVIRTSLEPWRDDIGEACWSTLRGSATHRVRLRAALALAALAPDDPRWAVEDRHFLVEQLVSTSEFYQPVLLDLLENTGLSLGDALEAVCLESNRPRAEQISAARALTTLAPAETDRLGRLLPQATAVQFPYFYGRWAEAAGPEAGARFKSLVATQPGDQASVGDRVELGKQRAGAAVALLRGGDRTEVEHVLKFRDDPEALTQFVHGCRDRGVTAATLLECFHAVDHRRGPLGDDRRKVDDSVLYGLLLALGEFAFDELPQPRTALVDRLASIYARDPSSGIHGASGWLLRHWGFAERVQEVDETVMPCDPTGYREWYVRKISALPLAFVEPREKRDVYFTFVVFRRAEVTLGSPESEPDRHADETLRRVRFTRPLSVLPHELSWRQWEAMVGPYMRQKIEKQFNRRFEPDDPVIGVSWYMAVEYCRWLTVQSGLSEEDQFYVTSDPTDHLEVGVPADWQVGNASGLGFRLPTDAEWEYVCRAGTRTTYSFGSDQRHLAHYAWFLDNSDGDLQPGGRLRPNPRGLFDLYGNLDEWCHDRYGPDVASETDPLGPKNVITDVGRVSRGAGWGTMASNLRSANRGSQATSNRKDALGFRIVVTPPLEDPKGPSKSDSSP